MRTGDTRRSYTHRSYAMQYSATRCVEGDVATRTGHEDHSCARRRRRGGSGWGSPCRRGTRPTSAGWPLRVGGVSFCLWAHRQHDERARERPRADLRKERRREGSAEAARTISRHEGCGGGGRRKRALPRTAAPLEPPPERSRGTSQALATSFALLAPQICLPASRAREMPASDLKAVAASGALSPSILHAAWLRHFPTNPRTVPLADAERFVAALAEEIPLSSAAAKDVMSSARFRGASPM